VLGQPIPAKAPYKIARRGLAYVPDDRALFKGLTVVENLRAARKGSATIDVALDYFPALRKRLSVRAGALSGGEQQMLVIARGLVTSPKILMIDELSMGLAPAIVAQVLPVVRKIADETGAAVVLVEQHVQQALAIADRAIVLVHGDVRMDEDGASLRADPARLERAYLGDTAVTHPDKASA
jgi:branched-chain amino acid transport system ATP-binding protein